MKAVGRRAMPQIPAIASKIPIATISPLSRTIWAMSPVYARSARTYTCSKARKKKLRCSTGLGVRSHKAHCVGLSVAALTALISAVTAITNANCANIWPLNPGTKAAGKNTAISTSDADDWAEQFAHRLDRGVVAGHALLDIF